MLKPQFNLISPQEVENKGYISFNNVPHHCLDFSSMESMDIPPAIILHREETQTYHIYTFDFDAVHKHIHFIGCVGSTEKGINPQTKTLAFFLDAQKQRVLKDSQLFAHISKTKNTVENSISNNMYEVLSKDEALSQKFQFLIEEIPYETHVYHTSAIKKDFFAKEGQAHNYSMNDNFIFTVSIKLPFDKYLTLCFIELNEKETNIDVCFHSKSVEVNKDIYINLKELTFEESSRLQSDVRLEVVNENRAVYGMEGKHRVEVVY